MELVTGRVYTCRRCSSVRCSSTVNRRLRSISQVGFWKVFGRPILKVLLTATLTYQVAYWGWLKLELDEARVDKQGTAQVQLSQIKTGEN